MINFVYIITKHFYKTSLNTSVLENNYFFMNYLKSFKILLFILISTLVIGCQNSRQVVPVDVDTDKIFEALQPNDDSNSMDLVFGPQNIPGTIFDTEFTTDKPEVFIYFQNLTVLDVNPDITASLLDFVTEILLENDFITESDPSPVERWEEYVNQNIPYNEAAAGVIDSIKQNFETKNSKESTPDYPCNVYFNIYPVYLDDNYVTYRHYAYTYTGGAHGIPATYLVTYNLKTGQKLSMGDIVKSGSINEVREEVVAALAYSYPIYENISTVDQYLDSLNGWLGHFQPLEQDEKLTINNFPLPDPAVTSYGLVFIYQMYEIAPASEGSPVVLIPYKDLHGCLNIKI